MRFFLIILNIFLICLPAANADPLKIYEIFNVSNNEFINKSGTGSIQCEKFDVIPPNHKVNKIIDFDDMNEIDCIAVVKDNSACGIYIKLIPRSLLKTMAFGDCFIQTRPKKRTQVIDNLFIG